MSQVCKAEHIAVGSEILLGQILNGHARAISLEFAAHGLNLYYHSAVGDNMERILQSLEIARSRSNVVVVTGGLGPTKDDLTKEALAAFLNRPLELSEDSLRALEAYFVARKRRMPEENRKQALCISGGEVLPNPNGTAPGQYVEADGVHYFLLPGPPLEMVPMLKNEVLPRLRTVFSNQTRIVSRVLHFCGIGESDVDEQIGELTAAKNPTVAPLASEGEMLLRITAAGNSDTEAQQYITPVEQMLREKFASFIYGVDDETLPSVVLKVLSGAGQTLAVAESCTGGLIASMLTAIPGSSAYFAGGVVAYQNEVKEKQLGVHSETLTAFGAVSEQTAREMAEGVRSRLNSTYGLSVTGIAGPSGGTPEKPVGLVYGAVAGPDGTQVFRMQFRGSREQVRIRTAKQMLWRLWRMVVVKA
uniref:competence/damage-inducible protein A n=1 Tax=Alicyclobacillus tolerans TaxID=90970 RepID=UPI0027E1943E|nr:competence/damage-inducible protein A [Alicyclobacillus tolerans]